MIPVQYLRVGDVVDLDVGDPAYFLVQELTPSEEGWWRVGFDQASALFPPDREMRVVGHDLELWDEPEEALLIQEEWSLEQRKYVAEHSYVGQAD